MWSPIKRQMQDVLVFFKEDNIVLKVKIFYLVCMMEASTPHRHVCVCVCVSSPAVLTAEDARRRVLGDHRAVLLIAVVPAVIQLVADQ